jgi:hypothetical protein
MKTDEMANEMAKTFDSEYGRTEANILVGGGVDNRPRSLALRDEAVIVEFLSKAVSILGPDRSVGVEIGLGDGLMHVVLRRLCGNAVSVEGDRNRVLCAALSIRDAENSTFVWGNPEHPVTAAIVGKKLDGKKIDVLFVGECDSQRAVSYWLLYGRLVREGGIVAFLSNDNMQGFLDELKTGHRLADGPICMSQTEKQNGKFVAYYVVRGDSHAL